MEICSQRQPKKSAKIHELRRVVLAFPELEYSLISIDVAAHN